MVGLPQKGYLHYLRSNVALQAMRDILDTRKLNTRLRIETIREVLDAGEISEFECPL